MFRPLMPPKSYGPNTVVEGGCRNPFASLPVSSHVLTSKEAREQYRLRQQEKALEQYGIRVARDPIAGSPRHWPKIWPGDALSPLKRNKLNEHDEQAFLKEFNRYRKAHGLKPVRLNPELSEAADQHSHYQAEALNSCDHYGPRGKLHWFTGRAKASGYQGRPVNENVAAGQKTVQEALWAWHMSPGHRKTMLDPKINEIGIGYRRGKRGPYGGERWTLMTGRGDNSPDREHVV